MNDESFQRQSRFRIFECYLVGLKYKPALSKSDSSWDNSYCVRLVIVSLYVNIGKLYLKFLINVSNKDALSICNRLLCSAINKRNKELQHLSKELSLSENVLSTQVSTIDFYILTKSITYHKKSLQKSVYTQQKKLSSWTRDCNLPIFTANKTNTNLMQYELSRKNLIQLKPVYTFQSNQITFKNPKFSLPSKRFIIHFLQLQWTLS